MCGVLGSWTVPGLLIQAGCIPTIDPGGEGGKRRKFLLCFHLLGETYWHIHVSTVYHFSVLSCKILRLRLHFVSCTSGKSEVSSSPDSLQVVPAPLLRSWHPWIPSPWTDRIATKVTGGSLFLNRSHLVLMRTLSHGWQAATSKVQPRGTRCPVTYHRLTIIIQQGQQSQNLSLSKRSLSPLPSGLSSYWVWGSVFPTGCEISMWAHSASSEVWYELLILTKQACTTSWITTLYLCHFSLSRQILQIQKPYLIMVRWVVCGDTAPWLRDMIWTYSSDSNTHRHWNKRKGRKNHIKQDQSLYSMEVFLTY